jgi:hypothetical protein
MILLLACGEKVANVEDVSRMRGEMQPLTRLLAIARNHPLPVNGEREINYRANFLYLIRCGISAAAPSLRFLSAS